MKDIGDSKDIVTVAVCCGADTCSFDKNRYSCKRFTFSVSYPSSDFGDSGLRLFFNEYYFILY